MFGALWRGIIDGWDQPRALNCGMTWDAHRLNRAYDSGANLGQWFGRLVKGQ